MKSGAAPCDDGMDGAFSVGGQALRFRLGRPDGFRRKGVFWG